MTFIPKWKTTSALKPGNITMIFTGMMALSENSGSNQYEFLCHGATGGDKNHQLTIAINGKPLNNISKIKEFNFHVLDKNTGDLSASNSIGAYTPNPVDEFAFNHLIDIEQIYGRELKKKEPLVRTNRITVRNGVIYSAKLTEYEFSLIDSNGNEIMKPRQITEEIGINISLSDNESGVLIWFDKADNIIGTEEFQSDQVYRIIFNNECSDPSQHNLKCKDSDFPLNYENIIDEPTISKYDLKAHVNIMSENTAPCSSTGYGGSGGWQPPPDEFP